MDSGTPLWSALLGFVLLASSFGQRGDADEETNGHQKLIRNLEEKMKKVEEWQRAVDSLEARLNETVDELKSQKVQTEELKKETEGLKTRLDATEKEIKELKGTKVEASPRIAFSVSLANSSELYRGPCTDKALVYKRVFSNIGDAYDLNTGVFTAPVGGVYFFTFSTFGYNTHTAGAILTKNGVRQVSSFDAPTADGSDGGGNAAVLRLEAGDQVATELWDDGRVYDNLNGHTTFSGFLLFPL